LFLKENKMKKALSILIGLSLVVSAFGVTSEALSELTLSISTQGPDSYADGTSVLVGETYLLVYIKAGETFKGIRTDGSLVDPVNNVRVTTSLAIAGAKCGFKAIQYPAELYPAGGSWVIVLLDTRTAAGTVGGLVAGHSAAVASATQTAGGGTSLGELRATASSGSGLTADSVARATANASNPAIAGIDRNGDKVGVRIKDFTDGDIYEVQTRTDLKSGAWAPAVGGTLLQAKAIGVQAGTSAELPATLTVPSTDTVRFFRVIIPGSK
jgi:hypothetical protein